MTRTHKKRRSVLVALAMLGGSAAGVTTLPTITAQAAICNGTGWMSTSTETAYSELTSIQEPTCQHKAAAYCNGGWYASSTWKNFGQVNSRTCPNSWQISNYGWYTQY